ncbi:hypothetical protein [Streptomyces tibetensis]
MAAGWRTACPILYASGFLVLASLQVALGQAVSARLPDRSGSLP